MGKLAVLSQDTKIKGLQPTQKKDSRLGVEKDRRDGRYKLIKFLIEYKERRRKRAGNNQHGEAPQRTSMNYRSEN